MRKRKTNKLQLNRETIQFMDQSSLRHANGAAVAIAVDEPKPCTCSCETCNPDRCLGQTNEISICISCVTCIFAGCA